MKKLSDLNFKILKKNKCYETIKYNTFLKTFEKCKFAPSHLLRTAKIKIFSHFLLTSKAIKVTEIPKKLLIPTEATTDENTRRTPANPTAILLSSYKKIKIN